MGLAGAKEQVLDAGRNGPADWLFTALWRILLAFANRQHANSQEHGADEGIWEAPVVSGLDGYGWARQHGVTASWRRGGWGSCSFVMMLANNFGHGNTFWGTILRGGLETLA